jgi:sulfatase modifying factor 1
MTGNIMEWCSDWYDAGYYKQRVGNNPRGPATGKYKVGRGGSYRDYPYAATVTWRDSCCWADNHMQTVGFRIVRDYAP